VATFRLIYFLTTAFLILCSCKQKTSDVDSLNSIKLNDQVAILDSAKYSILKFDPSPFNFIDWEIPNCSRPSILLSSEILELEDQLEKSVVEFNTYQRSINGSYDPINLTQYKRQLIVFINTNGEKEVLVNCFCSNANEPNWKNNFVDVIDGGECYFNVIINLTLKNYHRFAVNSLA
jgi:hypothetical protein